MTDIGLIYHKISAYLRVGTLWMRFQNTPCPAWVFRWRADKDITIEYMISEMEFRQAFSEGTLAEVTAGSMLRNYRQPNTEVFKPRGADMAPLEMTEPVKAIILVAGALDYCKAKGWVTGPIVLTTKGVALYDQVKASGYSPTVEQVRSVLKAAGPISEDLLKLVMFVIEDPEAV